MELSITNEQKNLKEKSISNTATIFYNGIGCKFRNYFTEKEFRNIMKKNIKFLNFKNLETKYYNYFKNAINNPLNCDLDLLIEFSGALKLN